VSGRRVPRYFEVMRGIAMVACVLVVAAGEGSAQMARVGSYADEYARLLQLTGAAPLSSRMIRPAAGPSGVSVGDSASWRDPWGRRWRGATKGTSRGPVQVRMSDVAMQTVHNTAIPNGANDGVLWAGRGLSTVLTAGAIVKVGPVTLDVAPSYTWSRNADFKAGVLRGTVLPTASPFADVWTSSRQDRPQRFGNAAVSRGDAGQSSLTVALGGVAVAASSANMWWGPGIDNSLLMSNNAPGFPHVTAGTERPRSIGIGRIEAQWTVGTLQQSAFWRTAADTMPTGRWINALTFVFEPKGAPGLYLGATRLFMAYRRYNPISVSELLSVFEPIEKKDLITPGNPTGNDTRDQMLTGFARLVLPASGFELYGEYGRNDHDLNLREVNLEPDHSRAYVLGAQKLWPARTGFVVVHGEIGTLGKTKTSLIRSSPSWYTHHIIQQGYTQRGQTIGAAMGTGSNSQSFTADWWHPGGKAGFVIQRMRENDDAFFTAYNTPGLSYAWRHDVTVGAGPRVAMLRGPLVVELQVMRQVNYNRYTIERNDITNYRMDLRAEWRPRSRD
jgi:hypothetical protein